jgi:hypothetical protein
MGCHSGLPAVFSASGSRKDPLTTFLFSTGIVSDVGDLVPTVSAQELNFQTDGPIICQALFQRLAPRAPQVGPAHDVCGDRIDDYFDVYMPPWTVIPTIPVPASPFFTSDGPSCTLDNDTGAIDFIIEIDRPLYPDAWSIDPGGGVGALSGLDNDTGAIDFVRWGAVDVPSTCGPGNVDLDDFESRRSLYIGPID